MENLIFLFKSKIGIFLNIYITIFIGAPLSAKSQIVFNSNLLNFPIKNIHKSNNNSYLLLYGDNDAQIWDVDNKVIIHTFNNLSSKKHIFNTCKISSTGKSIYISFSNNFKKVIVL